ncbi:MAG: MFS transporter [Candidatus Sumerlaeota bacterium]|nr:MFS transporter [Candidatus Sumerlaeota bacterium]
MRTSSAGFSRAVLFLGFLTLLNVLNFADRQLPANLGFQIEPDLGIRHAQIALLTGYAFVVFYTLTGMALGAAADRWSRPRLIALGVAVFSAATAASGWARSYGHLVAARVFVGIGEASLTPAAVAMLSDVFPAHRRALAGGIYYAGIPLGTGVSLMIPAWLVPRLGWRGCFGWLGAAGLLLAPLALALREPLNRIGPNRIGPTGPIQPAKPVRPEGRTASLEEAARHRNTRAIFGELGAVLTRSPALSLAILGSVAVIFTASSTNLVLLWLQAERGYTISIGVRAGLIYLVGGVAGNVAGGWIADACQRRWPGGRLWFLGLTQLAFPSACIVFYVAKAGTPLFYSAWLACAFCDTLFYGPVLAVVQDLTPARIRSTAIAFLIFAQNFLGVGPGQWLAGRIGDRPDLPDPLTHGLIGAALVGYLAVPLFLAAARSQIAHRR